MSPGSPTSFMKQLALVALLVSTSSAVRPFAESEDDSNPEQLSLHLHASGHAQGKVKTSLAETSSKSATKSSGDENVAAVEKNTAKVEARALKALKAELQACSKMTHMMKKSILSTSSFLEALGLRSAQKAPEDGTTKADPAIDPSKKGEESETTKLEEEFDPFDVDRNGKLEPKELEAKLNAETVEVNGVEMVPKKTCQGAQDVLNDMLADGRHVEVLCIIASIIAFFVLIIGSSMWVGRHIKPNRPIYWKNNKKYRPSEWLSDSFKEEVDVTEELRDTVQKLFDATTLSEKMGGGDGKWQTHKGFKVLSVKRWEHGALWTEYAKMREATPSYEETRAMQQKLVQEAETEEEKTRITEFLKKQEELFSTTKEVFSKRQEDEGLVGQFMKSLGLDTGKNEVLLFHGSPMAGGRNREGKVIFGEKTAPVNAIKKTGFDERLGNAEGMLGSGTYFGDHISKADCYAGRYAEWKDGKDPGSKGEIAACFLARVCLGTPYMADQSLEGLRRPPCLKGSFDGNLCGFKVKDFNPKDGRPPVPGKQWNDKGVPLEVSELPRHDCVISDLTVDGDTKSYREYVLYEKSCYPEFVVEYKRLSAVGADE